MLHKTLAETASQLLAAAELETYLALDALPTDERAVAAGFVTQRLHKCVTTTVQATHVNRKEGIACRRAEIREVLLTEINAISLELISLAKNGFDALGSARITILINTANRGEEPDFDPSEFRELPFIRFHGEALDAALRIRAQPERVQMDALQFARYRWELDGFEMSDEDTPESETNRQREEVKAALNATRQRLPVDVLDDVDAFYECIEGGSVYAYAVPIGIPLTISRDELRSIGEAFRGIGGTFGIPFELKFDGPSAEVDAAHGARLRYESAGVGLQILSAWMAALEVLNDDARPCSICYRHASAISRCSVHSTKTQETRVARLGKRIRPRYQQRLLAFSRVTAVKMQIRTGLTWSDEANEDMQAAADLTQLGPSSRRMAIVLANQIRELLLVMNDEIHTAAEKLFHSILAVAAFVEALPPPSQESESRFRERQRLALKELLSIKGFFRAWCGSGRYSAEIDLRMLGFDRDHPVIKGGPLASTQVSSGLVRQRAWYEAAAEFTAKNMPTAADVNRLLGQGLAKREAAKNLGIGLSTVYKILNRGRKERKRQYLSRK
jgi:hypothetical protein